MSGPPDPGQEFADLLHGAATRGTERVIGVPDTAGPNGETLDDPAEALARLVHDATCPCDVEPLSDAEAAEVLSRLPAPNKAQGSSATVSPTPTLAQQLAYHDEQVQAFADYLHHKVNRATGDPWRTGHGSAYQP